MNVNVLLTTTARTPDPTDPARKESRRGERQPEDHDPAPAPARLRVLRVVDSRPPAQSWDGQVLRTPPVQPSLLTPEVESGPMVRPDQSIALRPEHAWTATPAAHLPDAATWSRQMARLLVETIHGQRSVGQLTRWVDERVLASVIVLLRTRAARLLRSVPGSGPSRSTVARRPPVLQSVRVQCPSPEVLEVSVHVRVGYRSEAIAFRLEGWYDRWLCTALEIGPRHSRGVEES